MSNAVVKNEELYRDDNKNSEETISDKNKDNFATKNILLYKNGDLYFPAKRIVVNKKYFRNWGSFLEELTRNLNPRNGAIRDVRTPFHGTRVKSLDDLIANGKYVAISKGEGLKLLDYTKVIDLNNQTQTTKSQSQRLKPVRTVNTEFEKIESRVTQNLYTRSSVIYIFRNGDPYTRAIKVIIKPQEQKHMNNLVKAIEDRVLLQENKPIRRIYTLNGDLIRYAKDMEDGHYYVAASNEPFENIRYGQYLPVVRGGRVPSKRHPIKYLNQLPTPRDGNRTDRYSIEESTHRSQKSTEESNTKPKSNSNRQRKTNANQREEKEKAAKIIQSAFRGYYTRKEIKKARDNNMPIPIFKSSNQSKVRRVEKLEKSRDKIDSSNRNNYKETKITSDDKKLYDKPKNNDMRQQKAEDKSNKQEEKRNEFKSEKIVERKYESKLNKTEEKKNEYKSEKIGEKRNEIKPEKSNEKKHNTIKESTNKKSHSISSYEKEKAAIIIQASFRGYKTRKMFEIKTEDKTHKRVLANTESKAEIEQKSVSKKEKRSEKENKYNDEELEKAAMKIQAGFRGYIMRENLKRRQKAALRIQAGFRGYKTRITLRKQKSHKPIDNKSNDEDVDKVVAATKIQAGFRGYKARKGMKAKEEAAKRIQAGFRGYKARKGMKVKEEAAKRIQAGFRGYKARKGMKAKEEAAKRIQAGFRGFKIRKELKEKEEAAERIQAAYRSYQLRKGLAQNTSNKPKSLTPEEQAQIRNDAATRIQAAFRGHMFRRENI